MYDSSKSGWFDVKTFSCWFSESFIEHVKDQNGVKVFIGDNLASHFSKDVLRKCVAHNIMFVCLIPNATHLLQPLNVAVFRTLKLERRKILQDWRRDSRVKGSVPKNQFPILLAKLHNTLKSDYLVAGFKASGLYPIDRNQVLKRLPGQNQDDSNNVSDLFNEYHWHA